MTASYVIQILKVMAVTYLMGNWSAGFEWVKRIRRPKYKGDFPVSFVQQLNPWNPLKPDLKRPLNVLCDGFSKDLLWREDPSNPEKYLASFQLEAEAAQVTKVDDGDVISAKPKKMSNVDAGKSRRRRRRYDENVNFMTS